MDRNGQPFEKYNAMTPSRLRLGVATVLFLGWIGYLAFLVVRTREPVILSRPQLLHSDLVVLVEATEMDNAPAPTVVIKEIAWAAPGIAPPDVGSQLRLSALPDVGRAQGWKGKGEYLIPLQLSKNKDSLDITALPWSPGFSPRLQVEILGLGIVKATPETEKRTTQTVKRIIQTVKRITQNTPFTEEDLRKAGPKQSFVVKRNLDHVPAIDMQSELEAAGAKTHNRPGEYRIYAATPDAREQLETIKSR